ncbi:MAG: hypothetical protein AAF229_11530 [Pseudomonadota bacterium]
MASRVTVCVAAALLLSGCSSVGGLFEGSGESIDSNVSQEPSTVQIYLADVDRLLGPDPTAADRTWRELELDFERAPTTTNALRLSLAMATPGHANTDLARADGMLTDLLQRPELLLTDEQLLASVHLALLRSRVSAESSARQASNTESRSNARELAAARAQLELLQADNTRLRGALAETEQKLAAISEIERTIRERDGDAGVPTTEATRNDE